MTYTTLRARLLLLVGASVSCRSEVVRPEPAASAANSTGAIARPPDELLPLVEPPPKFSPQCGRVQCAPELAQALSPHYPAPFEHCSPLFSPNDPLQEASFSLILPRFGGHP
jgi:hypothetical protein